MGVDDAGDRDPAARELLDDHRVGRQVEPHPAVLLGDRDPEQPELLHLLDDRLRELVRVRRSARPCGMICSSTNWRTISMMAFCSSVFS